MRQVVFGDQTFLGTGPAPHRIASRVSRWRRPPGLRRPGSRLRAGRRAERTGPAGTGQPAPPEGRGGTAARGCYSKCNSLRPRCSKVGVRAIELNEHVLNDPPCLRLDAEQWLHLRSRAEQFALRHSGLFQVGAPVNVAPIGKGGREEPPVIWGPGLVEHRASHGTGACHDVDVTETRREGQHLPTRSCHLVY